MAIRFISPDWKALRKLDEKLQRAWFYIWDKADRSGVYDYDPEYLKLDLNMKVVLSLKDLSKLPECEILPGEKILIKNFISINYKILKENYNPHKPVFRDLLKNKLKLNSSFTQACFKLEEEDEEEDEDKIKEVSEKILPQQSGMPFTSENFLVSWQKWKVYRKRELGKTYRSIQSEQSALSHLNNLSHGLEAVAILILEQSIANQWQGLFEIKNRTNGSTSRQARQSNALADLIKTGEAEFAALREENGRT